jgi:hypothetical protein
VFQLASGYAGVNLFFGKIGELILAIIAVVGTDLLRFSATEVGLQLLDERFELALVVDLLAGPGRNNHLRAPVNSRLTIVALGEGLGGAILFSVPMLVKG